MDGESKPGLKGRVLFKHCPTCKLTKPASEFNQSKRSADGLYWECRSCKRERDRRDYEAHKDTRLSRAKEWKQQNPEKVRASRDQYRERRREMARKAREDRRKKRAEELGLKVWDEEPDNRLAS